MDPDDRLTEELAEELRRSLAEMRLHPEFREELKGRLLATPESRWQRWWSAWPALTRHRGAAAGVAVAVIAAAVLVPLAALNHSQPSTVRQFQVTIPPGVSGAHAADAAPLTCHSGTVHLTVAPGQATLAPGQSATFAVSVTGSSCPLGASVTGPSKASISIRPVPSPSSAAGGVAKADFEVIWSGRSIAIGPASGGSVGSGSSGTGKLAAGTYTVTVSVPPSSARASISITING
ncbi:MAG: hypothetical protein WA751_08935 [Candidatus Dormiibacterota bacterium]